MIPDPYVPAMFVIVALGVLLGAGALVFRTVQATRQRIGRLEDALRTYNNANAAVGRHVTMLENELRGLQRSRPEPAPEVPVLRQVAEFAAPAPASAQSCVAERRLAELLRTRLGSQRIN
ncbi:MAG: hypothetical protein KA739_10025 [Pseudomonadales bacterium]|nr:hypothetical protein [Gammaproteobacteria bacterium]MBP6052169.1 hypothetical protein [Pseudomonadales bacterium]MBK6582231.1 hypothetical protein [Gammaproteobacteria bacterium]MBK7171336.1 hypothetical protein [Gammaproteobacteria bacterium]MBK7521496.1 hypothetical protein [Gammaproteobacteria bacterium]